MYHGLTPRTGSHPGSLAVSRFRAQLAALRTLGYRSIRPGTLAAALRGEAPLPSGSVVLTFDDGYLDTLTEALPLLLEFGFTATCYVVAGAVGGVCHWTDPAPLMGWDHLRSWLAAGMEIGAHSVSHRDLTRLDTAALREEVEGAKARLEDRLGEAIPTFAYPFNRVDRRAMAGVEAAGYASACAGVEVRHSPYALSRVDVAHDSWAWFGLQLLPVYHELHGAYRALVPRRR